MPEYITKEQAKVFFDDNLRLSVDEWNMIFDGIDAIPAADVVPVRHGRYIIDDMGDSSCSECGARYLDVTQNYCPNCGAKMDGEA